MKTLVTSLYVAVALVAQTIAYVRTTDAGGPCYTGYCGPTYHAPTYATPVVKNYVSPAPVYVPPTQVIIHNNLIGVPVPISYERPLALQGSTYYGYTKVSDVFHGLDASLYLDKAERLTSQALTLSQNGRDSFDSGAQLAIQAQKDLAQTLAVGQVAREIVNSITDNQLKLQAASVSQNGTLQLRAALPPATSQALVSAKCVQCHAKFSDYENLSDDLKLSIFDRVTTADDAKRMPRIDGGKSAGEPLSLAERMLLCPPKPGK